MAIASVVAAVLAAFLVAGCTTTPPGAKPGEPPPPPPPIAVDAIPGFFADPLDDLAIALAQQCAMAKPPQPWPTLCATMPGGGGGSGGPTGSAAGGAAGGSSSAGPGDPTALRTWLVARFRARELVDAEAPDGLITGYYEPLLTGSLTRDRPNQVPLRGRPADLLTIDLAEVEPRLKGMRLRGRVEGQKVVPYYSRAETEQLEAAPTAASGKRTAVPVTAPVAAPVTGPAAAAAPVLAWADDAVDAFFLEIQGSGRVRLRDGSEIRVGYADQNGHPYRAIGRTLIDRGALARDAVTAPAIRRWLQENPATAPDVMRSNPSLVYFRPLPPPPNPALGPPGSLGVALTPLRSIAVDRERIPLGALVFLQTTHPVTGRPLLRIAVAQDTGGAIRGTKRADLFWGFGAPAAEAAGLMKAPARMWLFEPR